MTIRLVDSKTLGNCPCAVYMAEPLTVEINVSVLRRYTLPQWRFLMAHELGHYFLPTDSETEADRYALRLTAGRSPQSLKNAMRCLATLDIPASRMRALYREALSIDAARGNRRAAQELKEMTKPLNP